MTTGAFSRNIVNSTIDNRALKLFVALLSMIVPILHGRLLNHMTMADLHDDVTYEGWAMG